jgi:hypothetical protein
MFDRDRVRAPEENILISLGVMWCGMGEPHNQCRETNRSDTMWKI